MPTIYTIYIDTDIGERGASHKRVPFVL